MLNDYVCPGRVHLALGHTDLRKGIDGLAVMIQEHYGKNIEENDIFIFCGLRNDRIKALLWEGDGFLLLYKRLEKGAFRWPRKQSELTEINEEHTIDHLTERLRLALQRGFGKSSEKIDPNQLTIPEIFNEPEVLVDVSIPEPKAEEVFTEVKGHVRKKTHLKDRLPDDIPVEEHHHRELKEGDTCPICGYQLVKFGSKQYEHIKIIPAKVVLVRDITDVYKCSHCEETSGEMVIKEAEKPSSIIPGSLATAEAIAHIATEKFVQGTPLYRQEQQWEREGITLSRQTMSNWMMKAAYNYLLPIYEHMITQLMEKDILHADETPLQVLKEEGKSKSYMWLYRTGSESKESIVIYRYERDRKQERVRSFLEGFKGYLCCDGYAAYHSLPPEIIPVGCWAHLRRKFFEAQKALEKKGVGRALLDECFDMIENIFALERSLKDLPEEERHKKRLLDVKKEAEKFFEHIKTLNISEKSAFGAAVQYALNQEGYLMNAFLDGRLELTNNLAERSIKPFVIGRKNFLFANTSLGAIGSAVYYSLIETCKVSDINPYEYLVFALKEATELYETEKEDEIKYLTPAYYKAHLESTGEDL